jgi:BirA family biotin operon repressor/biotin-[acetyl-CoA-carboxylase] ligase
MSPSPYSFVRTKVHLDIVDSTSSHARMLVSSSPEPELPLLVHADQQLRGRGRGNNTWWSDAGSLTFTLVIDPAAHGLTPELEPRLALATGVAAVWAFEPRFLPHGKIQLCWPNDLEIDGKKLAGMLIECFETNRGRRIAIGIGVNVNTHLDHAPQEVRTRATALRLHWPQPESIEMLDVLDQFLRAFEKTLLALINADPIVTQTWTERDALRGRSVRVRVGDIILAGVGTGIDEKGRLLLATEREITPVVAGTILR